MRTTKRQQPERAEQRAILDVLKLVGAEWWVLGTTRKQEKPCPVCGAIVPDYQGTMQSPGVCDILAFVPRPNARVYSELVMIEVKAPDRGRISAAQLAFEAACGRADVSHIVGGVDAVLAWLRARGHRV